MQEAPARIPWQGLPVTDKAKNCRRLGELRACAGPAARGWGGAPAASGLAAIASTRAGMAVRKSDPDSHDRSPCGRLASA
jgi:hypothetical protein